MEGLSDENVVQRLRRRPRRRRAAAGPSTSRGRGLSGGEGRWAVDAERARTVWRRGPPGRRRPRGRGLSGGEGRRAGDAERARTIWRRGPLEDSGPAVCGTTIDAGPRRPRPRPSAVDGGTQLLPGPAVDDPAPARSTTGVCGTTIAAGSRRRRPSACAVDDGGVWDHNCCRVPAVDGPAPARSTTGGVWDHNCCRVPPSTAQRLRGRRRGCVERRSLPGPAVDGPAPARSTAGVCGTTIVAGPHRRRPSAHAVDGGGVWNDDRCRVPPSTAQRLRGRRRGCVERRSLPGPTVDGPAPTRSTAGAQLLPGPDGWTAQALGRRRGPSIGDCAAALGEGRRPARAVGTRPTCTTGQTYSARTLRPGRPPGKSGLSTGQTRPTCTTGLAAHARADIFGKSGLSTWQTRSGRAGRAAWKGRAVDWGPVLNRAC